MNKFTPRRGKFEAKIKERDPIIFCKLFVGNLKFSTTSEELEEFYSQFGEIESALVMVKDGKSRGFGFVTYKDPSSVDNAMAERPHYIGDRKTEPTRALPKEEAMSAENQIKTNKIFIGGLLEDVNEAELESYFNKYGNITLVEVMRDSAGKKRGFGFVTFDDHDAVDKIVLEKFHDLGGKISQITKAIPKEDLANFGKERRSSGRGRFPSRNEYANNYRDSAPAYIDQNRYTDNNYNYDREMPGNFRNASFGMDGPNNGGCDNPFNAMAAMASMMGQYSMNMGDYDSSGDGYSSPAGGGMRGPGYDSYGEGSTRGGGGYAPYGGTGMRGGYDPYAGGNSYSPYNSSVRGGGPGRFNSRSSPYRRR